MVFHIKFVNQRLCNGLRMHIIGVQTMASFLSADSPFIPPATIAVKRLLWVPPLGKVVVGALQPVH